MSAATNFDINNLFEGSERSLRNDAEYFSRLTDHKPELGRLNETHLVRLLREYLPPKIGIGTGFIVSGGGNPKTSPQCDIIFYDALNNSPFYATEAWSIYPIEMVYGVIEVKTTLFKTGLKDAFKKCAEIRSMAKTAGGQPNKFYQRQIKPTPDRKVRYKKLHDYLAPRFFVFGYNGWIRADNMKESFTDLSQKNKGAHIHGICNLNRDGSFYIQHRANQPPANRISNVFTNGFRTFLMHLPISLDSMLPRERLGLGFDLVDLEHYGMTVK